jgi:hypothetical protein
VAVAEWQCGAVGNEQQSPKLKKKKKKKKTISSGKVAVAESGKVAMAKKWQWQKKSGSGKKWQWQKVAKWQWAKWQKWQCNRINNHLKSQKKTSAVCFNRKQLISQQK